MVDTKTIELFRRDEMVFTVQELIEKALAAIGALFAGGHPIIVAYSGGKDSSVVAALVLHAAVLAKASGGNPLVIVTTGDTGVESPESQSLYQAETAKMRRFAKEHGVRLLTKTVQPTLLSTWQLKILSGRGLPSFPGSQSDCRSQDPSSAHVPTQAVQKACSGEAPRARNVSGHPPGRGPTPRRCHACPR